MKVGFAVLAIVMFIILGFLLLSNKSGKNCEFVASYEATKNPKDSEEKQMNIYNSYLEICKNSSFDYNLWKLQNNISNN